MKNETGSTHRPRTANDAISTPTSKIPDFASKEDEAEFWDTHDFTDFVDETDPIDITFGGSIQGPIGQIVVFRLEPGEEQALKRLADEAGESVSEYAHRLVSRQIVEKSA